MSGLPFSHDSGSGSVTAPAPLQTLSVLHPQGQSSLLAQSLPKGVPSANAILKALLNIQDLPEIRAVTCNSILGCRDELQAGSDSARFPTDIEESC